MEFRNLHKEIILKQLALQNVFFASCRILDSVKALTGGLGKDVANLVDLLFGEVASSSVNVDLGDLADEDGKTSTDTSDGAEGEANLLLSVNVRVHHTEQELELVGARQNNC